MCAAHPTHPIIVSTMVGQHAPAAFAEDARWRTPESSFASSATYRGAWHGHVCWHLHLGPNVVDVDAPCHVEAAEVPESIEGDLGALAGAAEDDDCGLGLADAVHREELLGEGRRELGFEVDGDVEEFVARQDGEERRGLGW